MRLPFSKVWRIVAGYRLGYSIQRDYPGRWTTPVVMVVYVALAVFLALMNIPLTAYDTVQEYTYTPNATIPPLPFSYLIPSFLRSRLPDFSPQTLSVGDMLYLNDSVEAYNISTAEVENFLYYNNPLTSCDVQSVTMRFFTSDPEPMGISAIIYCWFPVQFGLQWEFSGTPSLLLDLIMVLKLCSDESNIASSCDLIDLADDVEVEINIVPGDAVQWSIGGQPYCPGSSDPSNAPYPLPCNSNPIDFYTFLLGIEVEAADGTHHQLGPSNENDGTSGCVYFQDPICTSTYDLAKENAFQAVYHYIRWNLGIRSPNQIWASPVVFNETIQALPLGNGFKSDWEANELRGNFTGNPWVPWDMDHDTTIRTPKIYYSRWTYRRKSLGSAITSVFVATFTMLAAIWKIFSFVAGLVISKADDLVEPPSEWESEARELREEIASLTEVSASTQEELRRMMRSPAPRYRMSLADTGDSSLMESLLSSVDDDDSKEEDRNGYDRV